MTAATALENHATSDTAARRIAMTSYFGEILPPCG
jgi:hypothetical protein